MVYVVSDLHRLADEELMALVTEGDCDAFEVVYDRHCDAAFSLAYRMCGRRATAEEVLQAAFLALWGCGGSDEQTPGSVRNRVLRIVHNHALDALRCGVVHERHLFCEEDPIECIPGVDSAEVRALSRGEAREVQDALLALRPEQSSAIELAYFGGFTHAEIARMLETPVGTVKRRLRRGLAEVRLTLAREVRIAR